MYYLYAARSSFVSSFLPRYSPNHPFSVEEKQKKLPFNKPIVLQ